ncbi:MAG: GIY-YIG nuclease family protein [Candidatus Hodarchaeales archaeon]
MSKEKELHNRYHSKRIRGEWFDLNQKDIDYIKTL